MTIELVVTVVAIASVLFFVFGYVIGRNSANIEWFEFLDKEDGN